MFAGLMFWYMCLQDGIKIKSSSGFHGKGFKFDETEAQLVNDRKKLQKAALGLVDSDEEDPNEDVRFYHALIQITNSIFSGAEYGGICVFWFK